MMSPQWTIRIHRDAVRAIYRLPRGRAAEATEFLTRLTDDPLPEGVIPLESERGLYRYSEAGFQVIIELDDIEQTVRILALREY